MYAFTYRGQECAVTASKHVLIVEIGGRLVRLSKAVRVKPTSAEVIKLSDRRNKK